MPTPNDDFLNSAGNTSVLDLFYEKIGKPLRLFVLELKAADTPETRRKIIGELNIARKLRGGDFVGRVEIAVNLCDNEIKLNLEKPVSESDWRDWVEILEAIHGIEKNPQLTTSHTVVMQIGGFYRNKERATVLATQAVDLLHLTTAGSSITFIEEDED